MPISTPTMTLAEIDEDDAAMPWLEPEEAHDFYEVRVTVDRDLEDDEVLRMSGAIGYALREQLAGEPMGDPEPRGSRCWSYFYDSTKSRRSDPDYEEAFDLAGYYVVNGTPLRTTNRGGPGTKGTPLVKGIGAVGITFHVR